MTAMIELRWVTTAFHPRVAPVKALQYRHWIAYAAANGNAMFPLEPQWSDWLDVPPFAASSDAKEKS